MVSTCALNFVVFMFSPPPPPLAAATPRAPPACLHLDNPKQVYKADDTLVRESDIENCR